MSTREQIIMTIVYLILAAIILWSLPIHL